MADRLDHPEQQNDVAQIDREWEMERERYLIRSRSGQRYAPSTGAAVLMGVVSVGFGAFWVFITISIAGSAGGLFSLFGLFFIAAAVGLSIYQFSKAQRYRTAYREYQRRRAAAQDRQPPG
jgi:hypothetical protein